MLAQVETKLLYVRERPVSTVCTQMHHGFDRGSYAEYW